jgi:hypothetical protein
MGLPMAVLAAWSTEKAEALELPPDGVFAVERLKAPS